MKLFKEGLVLIDCGSAFHNFDAEYEKERPYNVVRDLGTERSPFSDDLKERVWVSDTPSDGFMLKPLPQDLAPRL